ncbi:hypothetical protein SAMN05216436_107145 [bacterium A37T11]|nr:hypothetical protein SAMN05216436_107145 [bacterium A37T11]
MADNLVTNDPVALRALMNETLFAVEEAVNEEKADLPDFLGNNKKNLLFLIDEPAYDFFEDADLEAFAKILAAKQLSMDDVAVINCAHHPPMDPGSLHSLFKPKNLIFLGADPLWAGCKGLTLNKPEVADGRYTLLTYSFAEMNQQQDKKKIFWSLIKQI